MIDVLVGVFIAVNTVFCCSFGATVLHTAYTERWPCLHCLHRSRPRKDIYFGVPEIPATLVMETIELGVRET